jgi:hypothetical protein
MDKQTPTGGEDLKGTFTGGDDLKGILTRIDSEGPMCNHQWRNHKSKSYRECRLCHKRESI